MLPWSRGTQRVRRFIPDLSRSGKGARFVPLYAKLYTARLFLDVQAA